MKDYCNLHVHTTFSILDSLIKTEELFKKVKELGQTSTAITDHGTLSSAFDALKYSKEAGVKLLMGCEFYFTDDVNVQANRLRHLILIAKNHQGYKNLLALSKAGFDNSILAFKRVVPRIDWKMLENMNDGLICTTACGGGILGQLINTRKIDEAKAQAKRLKDIFGESLALEIQPHAMRRTANLHSDWQDQRFLNNQLVKFGDELNIKVIAATDAHYLTKDQHEAHDVMLAIAASQPVRSGNRLKYTEDFWVKSRDEVIEGLGPVLGKRGEEFCDNTLFFSEMCEEPDWISPKYTNPSGVELPSFNVKGQTDYEAFQDWLAANPILPDKTNANDKPEDAAYLWFWCLRVLRSKLPTPNHYMQYLSRVQKEMEILEMKGLCSYMLIVADYINWSKNNNIPIGPGRGSGNSSLVGYLTNIHEVDPLKYGLMFERFYNKAKTGLSDIDIDVSQKGKPLLEQYVVDKYGVDYCAQISNYSGLTPKPYAKAISRTFVYGGDQKAAVAIGNSIANSIPKDIHSVIEALETAPLFAEFANTEKYHHLKTYAKYLGNTIYNTSTHAGAMIIGKRRLVEIVPLRRSKDGTLLVEYEKERAEAVGLAKMDILGLSTLDIIEDTLALLKANGKPSPLPWTYDDPKTYEMIGKGNTFAVFQLGTSGGTIDLCKKMEPKNIQDLAMINALTRPGFPKEVRDEFIEAKKANKISDRSHPILAKSFAETFGYPLYDEVLLQLAVDFAGWDLTEADRLRKFVKEKGKHPDKDKKLKKDIIRGAVENVGLSQETAEKIWKDVISNFGSYAFNKAHAIAYSMLGYQTAYLKANHPLEFLIANLNFYSASNAQTAADDIRAAKAEIIKLGVKILPPDINTSEKSYKIIDSHTVMTGFDSLKYIGKDSIPEILAKRPFTSFEHFLSNVDGKKVKAPAVQAMAACGCLDSFGMTRKQMFLYASDYKTKLQVWKKKQKEGGFNYPWPDDKTDWSIPEKYALERYYIGEGLTGTKIQAYPGFFNAQAPQFNKFAEAFPNSGDPSDKMPLRNFQAEIIDFFEFKVKKEDSKAFGKPMAKVMIEDPYETPLMMTIFPDKWALIRDHVKRLMGGKAEFSSGIAIHGKGTLQWYDGDISIILEDIYKCCPPPSVPADLKRKKVSMRILKSKKKTEELNTDMFLEEVEEDLIESGVSIDDDLEDWNLFDSEDIEQDLLDMQEDQKIYDEMKFRIV